MNVSTDFVFLILLFNPFTVERIICVYIIFVPTCFTIRQHNTYSCNHMLEIKC